jgi:hypothetical protein
VFGAICVLGFVARLGTAKVPVLDHHSWRQADTASIARNFVRERFNPLYPQVDWRGGQVHGYVETGMEVHAFIVAAISRLAGFHTDIGRFLSCAYFLGSLVLLHAFVRERDGTWTALVGAAAYAFGFALPFYMDRTFMNEPLLILLTFSAYRCTQRYLREPRAGWWLGLMTATTLIALVKPVYLVCWGGILGLTVERDGRRALRRWDVALVLAANLLALALWLQHARSLSAATGLSFGIEDKLFDTQLEGSLQYWRTIAGRLILDVFGPVGFVLLVWGLVRSVQSHRRFEPAALAGFLVYLVVVAKGNFIHDYYQLVAVPIGSVLVAAGGVAAAERFGRESIDARLRWAVALIALMIASAFLRSINSWYGVPWEKAHLCSAGRDQLAPADRVVLAGYQNPDLLFCLDRKGWILPDATASPGRVRELRDAGAAAVLVMNPGSDQLTEWLDHNGRRVVENRRFRLYKLSPGARVGTR